MTRLDAQNVINEVVHQGSGRQYDANGDGRVTARDALFVINRLSAEPVVSASGGTVSFGAVDRLLGDQDFLSDLSQTRVTGLI